MRFEDKEVEGPELEHEPEYARENELEEEDEEELPALEADEVLDTRREGEVMNAMRAILERRQIVINDLRLPQRELRALEALQAAVRGRDGTLDQFVYASDRRDLLEQALAILQPALIEGLGQPFDDLVHEVADLRHELKDLEDAQDELLEGNERVGAEQDETDSDDKPKPDDDTSLTGPERAITKPATSLTGPEVKEAPKPPSSLAGSELKEAPKPASSLYGDAVVEKQAPSSLDGPAIADAPAVPTSLGSEEDLEAASVAEPQKQKTKPWWRRPFG